MSSHWKREHRYPLEGWHTGRVKRVEATYALIEASRDAEWIRLQREQATDDVWSALEVGLDVAFRIAFTMYGPDAFEVRLPE